MRCTIHRGSREIGGSCIEVRTDRTRILLDMGYPLFLNGNPIEDSVSRSDKDTLLALGVLPQVDGLYAWDTPRFDAVIISHAHLDHYGLLPWLHPSIPAYLSGGTSALISLSQRFGICPKYAINQRAFAMYTPFPVGDITIKPYLMDHSAFDAAAFEVHAEGKTLLYTGDFRGHGRKPGCLDAFLRDAPSQADALLIEGTMLGRQQEDVKTESTLEEDLVRAMAKSGPILFQCSSQNVDRLVTFYRASLRTGRLFVIDVYTANVLHELRRLGNNLPSADAGYDRMKVFYPWRLTQRIFDEIGEEYARRFSQWHISKTQLAQEKARICMMVRPSMIPDLQKVTEPMGGQFVYSMWQGYRNTSAQQRLEHLMLEHGTTLLHVHSSGHARVSDLQRAIDALRPKRLIPVHGFFPESFKSMCSAAEVHQDGVEFVV